jgi:hypothetical protein
MFDRATQASNVVKGVLRIMISFSDARLSTSDSISTLSVRTTQEHSVRDATAMTLMLFKMVNHACPD